MNANRIILTTCTWVGVLLVTSCSSVPAITRTGDIYDVTIQEDVAPKRVVVQVGDEIRWVNHRSQPVRIDFSGDVLDDASCRRGFTNWIGMNQNTMTLDANETASVCFAGRGLYVYNVRMDSALPGGKQIVQGEVQVGKQSATN